MFDLDAFVARCRAAVPAGPDAIAHIVREAIADPAAIDAALGAPTRAGARVLYQAPHMNVIQFVWPPLFVLRPHEHRLWAVIGLYQGGEDNVYWRRRADDPKRIEPHAVQALRPGDVASLAVDVIHSVANPIDGLSAALHVYGGDLYATERSEWDALALTEKPHDKTFAKLAFERANAALAARG